eukprot:7382874-Prymnesium_polylepis.1
MRSATANSGTGPPASSIAAAPWAWRAVTATPGHRTADGEEHRLGSRRVLRHDARQPPVDRRRLRTLRLPLGGQPGRALRVEARPVAPHLGDPLVEVRDGLALVDEEEAEQQHFLV